MHDASVSNHPAPVGVLGFSVARWALALAASEARAVLAWPPVLARLPEAPPWLLGITFDDTRALPVVDLAGLLDEGADSTSGATHTLICAAGRLALPISAPRPLGAVTEDNRDWGSSTQQVPLAIACGRVSVAGCTLAHFDSAAVFALATRRSASWWRDWEGEIDGNHH